MQTRSVRDHRDIVAQAKLVSREQATLTELSQHDIDVHDRIVLAHESLSLDTGSYSARWRRVRYVYLCELSDSKIGELPNRSFVSPRRVRIPGPKEVIEELLVSDLRASSRENLVFNVIRLLLRVILGSEALGSPTAVPLETLGALWEWGARNSHNRTRNGQK